MIDMPASPTLIRADFVKGVDWCRGEGCFELAGNVDLGSETPLFSTKLQR